MQCNGHWHIAALLRGLFHLFIPADAPIVETEQTFIHTSENDETEVICTVHASPKAEVVWFKNGVALSKDQGVFTHRGSRHSIILPSIQESIFGVYKCKATNKFGSDEKTTEVSGNNLTNSISGEDILSLRLVDDVCSAQTESVNCFVLSIWIFYFANMSFHNNRISILNDR